ncbi:MAG TPA: hypothetical protein VFA05_03345 [Gaiellaceae bacterium]|nr:hypothetical protein [Gaiellaceae bacterium]
MITRATVAALAATTLTAGTAAAATTSNEAFANCGKLSAGGKSWLVEAAAVSCGSAKGIVRQVVAAKPDQVFHVQGGETDRFKRTFTGLYCIRSSKKSVAAIQCVSRDGKKSVLAVSKR